MFNMIEEKTQGMMQTKKKTPTGVASSSIVSESIQRSVFGVFS
jgi:hypothetical protein